MIGLGFPQAGFIWDRSTEIEGWLSRDPYTDDWILWSPKSEQMYRRKGWEGARWLPSPESEEQCLKLSEVYSEMMGVKI